MRALLAGLALCLVAGSAMAGRVLPPFVPSVVGSFNALIPTTTYTCNGTLALSYPTATNLATANVTVTGNCTITLSGSGVIGQSTTLFLHVVENATGGYSVSLPAPTIVGGNNGWPNNVAPVASTLPYAATYVRYVTPDNVVTQGFY